MKRILLLSILLVCTVLSKAQSLSDKDETREKTLVPTEKTPIVNSSSDFKEGILLKGPLVKIEGQLNIEKDLNSSRFAMLTWWNSKVGHTNSSVVMNGTRLSDGKWHLRGDGARSSIGFITTDIFSNMRFVSHHDDQFKKGKTLTDEQMIKENTKMIITTNGNIGIGTNSPQYKLDVNGSTRISGNLHSNQLSMITWGNSKVGYRNNSVVMNGTRSSDGTWHLRGDGARSSIGFITTDIFSNMRFVSHHDAQFKKGKTLTDEQMINENTKMIIRTNGDVGIGTNSPQHKLDVNGSTRISGNLHSNQLSMITWGNSKVGYRNNSVVMNGTRSSDGTWHLRGDGARSSIGFITTDIFSNMRFVSHHDAQFKSGKTLTDEQMINENTKMIIRTNGDVGIGTSSPQYKLDVNGFARADEIIVKAKTADFVFEDDYKLRDLTEVEGFIENNKHLPDVPSAAEMEKEGVGMAQMNQLLLQKVEELTLYLIEQNKELKKQGALLKQQQEQIESLTK